MASQRPHQARFAAFAVIFGLFFAGFGCARQPVAITGPLPANRPTTKPPTEPPPLPVAVEPRPAEKIVASAPCENEYLPTKIGQKLKYSLNGGSSVVTMTTKAGVEGRTVMSFSADGRSVLAERVFACDRGAVSPVGYFDPESLVVPSAKLEVQTVRGAYLPSDLKIGSSWTLAYDLLERSAGSGAKSTAPDQLSHVQFRNEAIGLEQITVPAGTFEALRVRSSLTSVAEVPGTSKLLPITTAVRNEWWVKGVGMVKMEDESGGFSMVAVEIGK